MNTHCLINLFGGVVVVGGRLSPEGQLLSSEGCRVDIKQTTLQHLVGRLAIRLGETYTRNELSQLLWGAVKPSVRANNLRVWLSKLRGLLAEAGCAPRNEWLQTSKEAVWLNPDSVISDVNEFHKLTKPTASSASTRERLKELEQATKLYEQGTLLPGFNEAWIVDARGNAFREYLHILYELVAHLRRDHQLVQALELAYRLDALTQTKPYSDIYFDVKQIISSIKIRTSPRLEADNSRLACATAYEHAGYAARREGRTALALANSQAAYDIYKSLNDEVGMASALNTMGSVSVRTGNYVQARVYFSECLERNTTAGNRYGQADAWHGLGWAHAEEGYERQALAHYKEAAIIAKELGYKVRLAVLYNNIANCLTLATCFEGVRNLVEAKKLIHDCIGLRAEINDEFGLALALTSAAHYAHAAREWRLVAEMYGAASAIEEKLGLKLWQQDENSQRIYKEEIAATKKAMGDENFKQVWLSGRSLNVADVLSRV